MLKQLPGKTTLPPILLCQSPRNLLLSHLTPPSHTHGVLDCSVATGDCPAPAGPFPCLGMNTGDHIPRDTASKTKSRMETTARAKAAILPSSRRTAGAKPRGGGRSAPSLSPCLKTSQPPHRRRRRGEGARITAELPLLQSPLFKFIYSTTGDIMIAGV